MKTNTKKITNTYELKYAFFKSIPVMCGYLFLGLAFGIVLHNAGYNFVWAFFISLFVYAGSMQFVMVPMLTGMVSPLTMAASTLFVNSRHLFYGLSFIESFPKMKSRFYMIFSLTDETYSILCSCKSEDPEEIHRPAWFLISILDHIYWITGSVIGALLGQMLPIDFTGIDFAMTALFIVILIEQIYGKAWEAKLAAVSGFVLGLLCLLIFGADKFLLPSLLLMVVLLSGVSIREGKYQHKEGECT